MTHGETLLEQRAKSILDALIALGPGWHGRTEIARKMGKMKMQTSESAALDYLVMQGKIEAERHPIDAPIRERWEYRVKQGV